VAGAPRTGRNLKPMPTVQTFPHKYQEGMPASDRSVKLLKDFARTPS